MSIKKRARLSGRLRVPGDKSISHRALIFSALTSGMSQVEQLSPAADCESTIACLRALGLEIRKELPSGQADDDDDDDGRQSVHIIESCGLSGLKEPEGVLYAGNSGTTIRLLSGLLAGRPFTCRLDGDESLRQRPMGRVLNPLGQMGAQIKWAGKENYPPFVIAGGALTGRTFTLPVASAQVQTAILLAGLQAEGETTVILPSAARDHTSRLFDVMHVPFASDGQLKMTVSRLSSPLAPFFLRVPADISSAAFFMVAAACLPGSQLTLSEVGLNPGRVLVLDVLRQMGADIAVADERIACGEPVADILVRGGRQLTGATVDGETIASGIDEIPVLALCGAFCSGKFSVRDAAELRVKESDRLAAIVENLRQAGASVSELPDGFDIQGSNSLPGGSPWKTYGDHRLAMTGMVASLLCREPVAIDDAACVAVSYPSFARDLAALVL